MKAIMAPCIDHGFKGNSFGYSTKYIGGRKSVGRHRLALAEKLGVPVESLKVVRHICNNPRCVNPEHLQEGTTQDNVRDRVESGRGARGEQQGSAVLTEEQVRAIYADKRPLKVIARDYPCSWMTVRRIKRGETWQHLKLNS